MATSICKESIAVNSKIESQDLLIDLKVLMKEYYCGTFTNDGQSLMLRFYNGQKFALKIEEIA